VYFPLLLDFIPGEYVLPSKLWHIVEKARTKIKVGFTALEPSPGRIVLSSFFGSYS
jgi:hypothetical protein